MHQDHLARSADEGRELRDDQVLRRAGVPDLAAGEITRRSRHRNWAAEHAAGERARLLSIDDADLTHHALMDEVLAGNQHLHVIDGTGHVDELQRVERRAVDALPRDQPAHVAETFEQA